MHPHQPRHSSRIRKRVEHNNFSSLLKTYFVQIRRKGTHFFPKNNNFKVKTTAKTTFKTTMPLQAFQFRIQKTAHREGMRLCQPIQVSQVLIILFDIHWKDLRNLSHKSVSQRSYSTLARTSTCLSTYFVSSSRTGSALYAARSCQVSKSSISTAS